MNKIINFILTCLWIIRRYTDKKGNKQHKFNLWNPLAYIMLIIVAVFGGLVEFFKVFCIVVKETIKDAYDN